MIKWTHIFVGVLLCGLTTSQASGICKPSRLPPATLKLIKPVLSKLVAAKAFEDAHKDKDGLYRGESTRRDQFEEMLEAILGKKSPTADAAIAFFLTIYTGEHLGEALVCEAVVRGKRMLPLIAQYSDCRPATGLEPLPVSMEATAVLANDARERIEKGLKCEEDL